MPREIGDGWSLYLADDDGRLPVSPHLGPPGVRRVVGDDFQITRNVEPAERSRRGGKDKRGREDKREPDHAQPVVRRCNLQAARIPTFPGWPAGP